ncbi:MAG: hypothetical protein ACRDA5_08095 [Clostridium sp.]
MKKFWKFYVGFESLTVLYFGSLILLYVLLGPIWGVNSISFVIVWEMLLFSIIIALFQYVFCIWDFPGNLYKIKRLVMYYFTLLIIGILFAKVFNCFDLSSTKNLIIAFSIYSISFISTNWGFGLYYKVTGEEYNAKLKLYKEGKK